MNNSEFKKVISLAYKLLIVSSITVYNTAGEYHTLDLWVRDLEKQVDYVESLSLVCPIAESEGNSEKNLAPLPKSINIYAEHDLKSPSDYTNLAKQHDVIQIAVNKPVWYSKTEFNFLKAARKNNICIISALSSNRAKTLLLNARSKGVLRFIKSIISYVGLNIAIAYFTKNTDGCFVVGEGLRELVNRKQPNVYVGTASWIRQEDILPKSEIERKAAQITKHQRLKLCIATRLEPMKGVHLALDALARIKDQSEESAHELLILGEGEELERLQKQSKKLGLDHMITFGGTRSYPDEFFNTIREYDLMLLTNLNDEQPRLIFDAISQGLIPVCPDSNPFKALRLEDEIYFSKGDANSLAETILNISAINDYGKLLNKLALQAKNFTIDAMHENRAKWVEKTLEVHCK